MIKALLIQAWLDLSWCNELIMTGETRRLIMVIRGLSRVQIHRDLSQCVVNSKQQQNKRSNTIPPHLCIYKVFITAPPGVRVEPPF